MPRVDLAAYEGREQAYIKHCLLEKYLPQWGWKVGSQWDSLVYIDGFAGPWNCKSPDFSDSSFGIAVSALDRVAEGLREARNRKLGVQCVFVEQDKAAFTKLRDYANGVRRERFEVEALSGEFIELLPAISQLVRKNGGHPFKFVFLDPKGWSDIPMQELAGFLNDRSCEVLINLMTRFIIRFLKEPDRADSYRRLFGRDEVLPLLQRTPAEDRADVAVREYCKSLRLLCGFDYVSSAVILEPNREDKRYFLVYATHHPTGVEVFKAAENEAARLQDEVRYETRIQKSGQPELPWGDTPKSPVAVGLWQKYCLKAKQKVRSVLMDAPGAWVPYSSLFCEAMAFPLVTPADLRRWVAEMGGCVEVDLGGSTRRRELSPAEDDWVRFRSP